MASLSDLYRNLGNSLELEEILSTLDQELRRLILYDALSVLLVQDGALTPAYTNRAELQSIAFIETRHGEDAVTCSLSERQPLFHRINLGMGQTGSALIFPLEGAVLLIQRNHDDIFSADDLRVLWELAPKLEASIENARRYRRVEQLAEADPLTGLANVRSLFQRLDAELARARRTRDTLAVLQCSLADRDRCGALRSPESARKIFGNIALKLRETCREYDFSARSGDDLVLILPGFRLGYLSQKQELIERIVREAGANAGLPLSAAVGAAFFPEDGADAEDLLATAAHRVILVRQLASLHTIGTH